MNVNFDEEMVRRLREQGERDRRRVLDDPGRAARHAKLRAMFEGLVGRRLTVRVDNYRGGPPVTGRVLRSDSARVCLLEDKWVNFFGAAGGGSEIFVDFDDYSGATILED